MKKIGFLIKKSIFDHKVNILCAEYYTKIIFNKICSGNDILVMTFVIKEKIRLHSFMRIPYIIYEKHGTIKVD